MPEGRNRITRNMKRRKKTNEKRKWCDPRQYLSIYLSLLILPPLLALSWTKDTLTEEENVPFVFPYSIVILLALVFWGLIFFVLGIFRRMEWEWFSSVQNIHFTTKKFLGLLSDTSKLKCLLWKEEIAPKTFWSCYSFFLSFSVVALQMINAIRLEEEGSCLFNFIFTVLSLWTNSLN